MNRSFLIMLTVVSSGSVWAADYVDTAKVVSSAPIYERVSEPKQECWNETVSSTQPAPAKEHSIGGALLGGLIGGVVGNQVGDGSGKTIATAAGAVGGAIIGDRVANNDSQQAAPVSQTREEKHCRQVESYRDVVRGYNVTYRYKGQDITTRMTNQPGETVRVGISVLSDTSPGDARDVRDNAARDRDNRDHDNGRRRYNE